VSDVESVFDFIISLSVEDLGDADILGDLCDWWRVIPVFFWVT
jgi:hypothetical protein